MQSQFLDQLLNSVPSLQGSHRDYSSIDIYTSGAIQMDCGMCGHPCVHDKYDPIEIMRREHSFGQIKVNPPSGVIIPYGNLTGLGGDVHDTFRVDGSGSILGGHTTFRLKGGVEDKIRW